MTLKREYFTELYGNESAKTRLGSAIDNGTLPHAFLILGPDGSGKKTLASLLTMALNCERKNDKGAPLPCGVCNTCRRIREGNFTDITRLSKGDGKATIGVEEVRLFRETMFLSPSEAYYKVYIIEEAERLTPNAQNALLTVLEEPPERVIIMLLCKEGDKMLTTIKSRTQAVNMQRFDLEDLKKHLVEVNDKARLFSRADEEALDGILMSADGRIGKALSLLSDKDAAENRAQRELIESFVRSLRTSVSYSELYSQIASLPTSRSEFIEALEDILTALRDLTLIKLNKSAQLLFYPTAQACENATKDLSMKRLLTVYDYIKDALADASRNVSVCAICADLGVKIKLI